MLAGGGGWTTEPAIGGLPVRSSPRLGRIRLLGSAAGFARGVEAFTTTWMEFGGWNV
jgi:hypothetical protein